MSNKASNLPIWKVTNGWREIFARIFEGVKTELNVTPAWLTNPATKRRLKLDMLYPEISVAVRFEGLQGKQRRRRLSLEEEAQQRRRAEARQTVSQEHGIHLILVDLTEDEINKVFQHLDLVLSRAGHNIQEHRQQSAIRAARTAASALARRVRDRADLGLYADLWDDRHYRELAASKKSEAVASAISYWAGMEVEHTTFGPGVVLSTAASNDDTLVTVDFVSAGQKTLAASLVIDKLLPR